MNSKLKDKYSIKDLHKKALGAYMFIDENRDSFSVKLDEVELKKAHTKGAMTKNLRQAKFTKMRVQNFLSTGDYTKPNGKPNLSKLAEIMKMTRQSVAKYV